MFILCNTLLPSDKVHAILADVGKKFRPIPVVDRVLELDVAPIITNLSTDSNILFIVLYFFIYFLIYDFCL